MGNDVGITIDISGVGELVAIFEGTEVKAVGSSVGSPVVGSLLGGEVGALDGAELTDVVVVVGELV